MSNNFNVDGPYYTHLPAPLSEKETYHLFKSLPDKEAWDKLICSNMRLVIYISKKFAYNIVSQEELISAGFLGLMKAVNTFDFEKDIKFVTYATKCIINEMLMFLRKNKKYSDATSLQSIICTSQDNYKELTLQDILPDPKLDFTKQVENINLLEKTITYILNYFSRRDTLLMLYKIAGKNQREIAKIIEPEPLSQSYVSRLQKKLVKKLWSNVVNNYKMDRSDFIFSIKDIFYFLKISKTLCLDTNKLRNLSLEVKQTSKYLEVKMLSENESFLLIAEIIKMLPI